MGSWACPIHHPALQQPDQVRARRVHGIWLAQQVRGGRYPVSAVEEFTKETMTCRCE